jgi:glycosyltransferase involved in cell wall biosynthesis
MRACVAVLAPNGGQNLTLGGAAYATMVMANTLAGQGADVFLLAANGTPMPQLESFFGIRMDSKVRPIFLNEALGGDVSFPPQLAPRLLSKVLERLVARFPLRLVVFGDDPPRGTARLMRRAGVTPTSYCHFSYHARSKDPLVGRMASNSGARLPVDLLYWRRFFDPPSELDAVICNSTVTESSILRLYPGTRTEVIHPPCPSVGSESTVRRNLAVHSAQIGRTLDLALLRRALELIPKGAGEFIFLRTEGAQRSMLRRLRSCGVRMQKTLARAPYFGLLSSARVCLSLKRFEPFGISTVEGMSAGAVPLVLRSSSNGSYTDVVDHGRYGLCFSSAAEFAERACEAFSDEGRWTRLSALARNRSESFSEASFRERFVGALGKYIQ